MEQPPEFVVQRVIGSICKLKKLLFRIKQSPRQVGLGSLA